MRKAIEKAYKLGKNKWQYSEKNTDEILQSLNPLPIAVEVSLDENGDLIVEEGYVKVIKYHFQ